MVLVIVCFMVVCCLADMEYFMVLEVLEGVWCCTGMLVYFWYGGVLLVWYC